MAFTLSISGSQILVTAGTGTLAELYADAVADTPGCMTNPSTNVYQVEGDREIQIQSGVTVSTNSGDTVGDTLQWNLAANKFPILRVQQGGILNLNENTTIVGDTNGAQQSYIYCEGEVNCNGTLGNEVIFEKHRSIYIYGYRNMDWDHVIIRDNVLSSGYNVIIQPGNYDFDDTYKQTFDDITLVGGPTETSTNGWALFYNGDYSSFTFNNFNMTNGYWALFYGCSNLQINGGTLLNTFAENRYWGCGGEGLNSWHYDPVNTLERGIDWQNQPKVKYKNYTFDDGDSGVYAGGIVDRGSVVYFEDCTFQNATYGVYANRGIAIYVGTTTFNSITTNRRWGSGGIHLHGRKLTLNVEDSLTNPIADATVTIRQKQGREHWSFRTDSSGNVLDPRGEPVVLIEREETSTGVFTEWSDGTGDQVHVIEVYKDGFTAHTQEVAFTEDKTITVTLDTAPPGSTKIYGATFYGSNIY